MTTFFFLIRLKRWKCRILFVTDSRYSQGAQTVMLHTWWRYCPGRETRPCAILLEATSLPRSTFIIRLTACYFLFTYWRRIQFWAPANIWTSKGNIKDHSYFVDAIVRTSYQIWEFIRGRVTWDRRYWSQLHELTHPWTLTKKADFQFNSSSPHRWWFDRRALMWSHWLTITRPNIKNPGYSWKTESKTNFFVWQSWIQMFRQWEYMGMTRTS